METNYKLKIECFSREGVKNLISCYRQQFGSGINLFLAPDPISIFWSDFSLIQADLECLEMLLERDSKWKFFINQVNQSIFKSQLNLVMSVILRGQFSNFNLKKMIAFTQLYYIFESPFDNEFGKLYCTTSLKHFFVISSNCQRLQCHKN